MDILKYKNKGKEQMNIVDGSCCQCGAPTYYDGTLPILCKSCRTLNAEIEEICKAKSNVLIEQPGLPQKPRHTWKEYMLAK